MCPMFTKTGKCEYYDQNKCDYGGKEAHSIKRTLTSVAIERLSLSPRSDSSNNHSTVDTSAVPSAALRSANYNRARTNERSASRFFSRRVQEQPLEIGKPPREMRRLPRSKGQSTLHNSNPGRDQLLDLSMVEGQ
jgi:hypothetical protein